MKTMTFVSGWGGFLELFPKLKPQRFLLPFVDFSSKEIRREIAMPQTEILVGWSFGAFCILLDLPKLARLYSQIVLLAPFLNFQNGQTPVAMQRLQKAVATRPQTAFNAFWRACGCPFSFQIPVKYFPALQAGLTEILQSEFMPELFLGDNLTIVNGGQDTIVPPEANHFAKFYPRAKMRILPQNGHWFCAEQIYEFCR